MIEEDDDIQDYKRPWVGLTDEEVLEIIDDVIGFNSCWGPEEDFARAIEAKLKGKNTGLTGLLLLSSASIAKKNTSVQTAGQVSRVFAQSLAATRAGCFQGSSTSASTATTSLWRDLTTAQIGVFVVVNAF